MSHFSFIITVLLILGTTVNYALSAPVKRQTTATTITYAQFLGMQINWTRNQVTQYMNNNPGIVNAETSVPGVVDVQMVQYTNTNPIGVIELIFTNGLLTSKSQSGLNPNKYPITRAQYDQISINMLQSQVISIVGNGGQIMGEGTNSVELVGYNGSDAASYAVVLITFINGIVTAKVEVGL